MDSYTKQGFGVILGEIYRLQNHLGVPSADPIVLYGLTNGVESVIDTALHKSGPLISSEAVTQVAALLADYDKSPEQELAGYLDLEPKLQALGIDRAAAIRILTFVKGLGLYEKTFARLNSENSPSECRLFELPEVSD
ncbi:MAG: hypothetical protein JWL90_332 [Chthoniobacteraceae bacterium]|nr:hypothetical protein [Chthoniobacteraceae bacterium]